MTETMTGAGFGYKIDWLAVRSASTGAVAAVLGLGRLTPATWPEAVRAAYADGWLLTPPINGWTLVASRSMPVPADKDFAPWLAGLSASLGHVQYFGSSRIVDYYAWARARDGVVERAFGYLGGQDEALFDIGDRTDDELTLGVGFMPVHDWWGSDEQEDDVEDEDDDPVPDEETVLALAGRWSVDPRSLEGAAVAGSPWIAEDPH